MSAWGYKQSCFVLFGVVVFLTIVSQITGCYHEMRLKCAASCGPRPVVHCGHSLEDGRALIVVCRDGDELAAGVVP